MNKQQRIVKILRREYDFKLRDYVQKMAERAAVIAGARVWDQHNPEDGVGGISGNPYKVEAAKEAAEEASQRLSEIQEVLDFAVETFLGEEDV